MSADFRITEWPSGIWQIQLPMAFPLRWVNAYVGKGPNGWSIIDAGLHNDSTAEAWEAVQQQLGFEWAEVEQLLLTHHHPDHIGYAGTIANKSDCQVRWSEGATLQAANLWGDRGAWDERLLAHWVEHGLPIKLNAEMKLHVASFHKLVSPLPKSESVYSLHEGQYVDFVGHKWQVLDTPGHAIGHISLFQEERGEMICGDHVIPQITPNITYLPGVSEDPLEDYLNSLERMKKYNVRLAFPGHRAPFSDYPNRLVELQQHHIKRLQQVTALLNSECQTAYNICLALFGMKLGIHSLRFALAETIAHLIHLHRRDKLKMTKHEQFTYWSSI